MKKDLKSKELFFIGIVLSLLVGVPFTIFSIVYFADNIKSLVTGILITIFVLVVITGLIIVFRDRILKWIYGSTFKDLVDISETSCDSFDSFSQGEFKRGKLKARESILGIFTYISWLRFKRWSINTSISLLIAFSALIGSSLLFQQNNLILEQNDIIYNQNKFIQKQIELQQGQISSQQKVDNQNEKRIAIEQLYDNKGQFNSKLKSEAFKSLYQLNEKLLENVHIDSAYFRSIKFENLRLYKSTLPNAEFICTFINSHFSEINLNYTDFSASGFENCRFFQCKLNYSDFSGVSFEYVPRNSIENAMFNYSDLKCISFGFSKVLNCLPFKACDLRFSDFSNINGIENVELEECNIYGINGDTSFLNRISHINANNNISYGLSDENRFDIIKFLEQEKPRLGSIKLPSFIQYGISLNKLGFAFYVNKRFDEAQILFMDANSILRKAFNDNEMYYVYIDGKKPEIPTNEQELINNINNLGELFVFLTDKGKAINYFSEAQELISKYDTLTPVLYRELERATKQMKRLSENSDIRSAL